MRVPVRDGDARKRGPAKRLPAAGDGAPYVLPLTDLLEQGVNPDDVQHLAGHSDRRTTRLYDRRRRRITRNIVERISV